MSKIRIYGDTSGYVDLTAPAVADNSALSVGDIATESYADAAAAAISPYPIDHGSFSYLGAAISATAGNYTLPFNTTDSSSGITLSSNSFTFDNAGSYMATFSWRIGNNTGDVWTFIDMYNAATGTVGVSPGFGNTGTNDPGPSSQSFIVNITNTSVAYSLRLTRSNATSIIQPVTQYGVTGPTITLLLWRVA